MIVNVYVTVVWEDLFTEKVFIPVVPALNDVITTPQRRGIVISRDIDATKGIITVHANTQN